MEVVSPANKTLGLEKPRLAEGFVTTFRFRKSQVSTVMSLNSWPVRTCTVCNLKTRTNSVPRRSVFYNCGEDVKIVPQTGCSEVLEPTLRYKVRVVIFAPLGLSSWRCVMLLLANRNVWCKTKDLTFPAVPYLLLLTAPQVFLVSEHIAPHSTKPDISEPSKHVGWCLFAGMKL